MSYILAANFSQGRLIKSDNLAESEKYVSRAYDKTPNNCIHKADVLPVTKIR